MNERAEWIAEQRAAATKVEQQLQRRNRLKAEIEDTEKQYELEQPHLGEARKLLSASLDQMEVDRIERERLQTERVSVTEALTQKRDASREASAALMRGDLQSQNLQAQVATSETEHQPNGDPIARPGISRDRADRYIAHWR